MIVAGLPRHLTLNQIARGLKVEHEDLGLQKRGFDRLALAGIFPLQQRDENAERGEQPGAQIGKGDAGANGPWPGRPLIDIKPPMPCATWSKPGRPAYGPSWPKPEMLA